MKSLSRVSFLILAAVVFHLFSSASVVETHGVVLDNGTAVVTPPTSFCVPTEKASDAELQKAMDFACGQGIDCGPIQPGAVCGDPPTVRSRAAFAMNSYYRFREGNPRFCDFNGIGRGLDHHVEHANSLRIECTNECDFAPCFCCDEAANHFAAVHKLLLIWDPLAITWPKMSTSPSIVPETPIEGQHLENVVESNDDMELHGDDNDDARGVSFEERARSAEELKQMS
ncbi:Detected protein of unknown function [Hibiscus syriacus]|uniref:X8 domain-containing protein n=1 Tax=Hibiscus syriacus TaxID=106335 RepID=A0A6A2X3H4_HIBSY|nr:Detected protein of unknown function [Hibiscus syriacus]